MNFNPEIVCKEYKVNSKTLTVVQDDKLYAGTKQRAVVEYTKKLLADNTNIDTLLYSGSFSGFGPLAAALGGNYCGINVELVLDLNPVGGGRRATKSQAHRYTPVIRAKELGANVRFVEDWGRLNRVAGKIATKPGVHWLPLGLDDDVFLEELTKAIKQALPDGMPHYKNIWVVGGVGLLARVLANVFPNSTINVVSASRSDRRRNKLSESLQSDDGRFVLHDHAPVSSVPYTTVKGYDSRAWDAAVACGDDGDLVWNVAGAKYET